MHLEGANRFLEEIESHCQSKAIATFLGSDGEPWVIDLKRKGDRVVYGSPCGVKEVLIAKLLHNSKPVSSLILRSLTPQIDALTQLPIEELRGYILTREGDRLEYEKLSPELMFAYQNTDAETGEPLPLEQSVRYC